MKTLKVRLTSSAPLLMHSGQLANPQNEFSKQMKVYSSKRKKVDADHEMMAKIEFMGSLYVNEKGEPVIPGDLITATLVNGAKAAKKGKDFKASVFSTGLFTLVYDGPKNAEALFADKAFVNQSLVRVQQARVLRTRPIFNKWSVDVEVSYLDNVQKSEIMDAFKIAGERVGIGDWRPTYGRFTVEEI